MFLKNNSMNILKKIFGSNLRILKKFQPLVKTIDELEEKFSEFEDSELKNIRSEFILRHESGESLEQLLPEAFAVTREVAKRKLNLRHLLLIWQS